MEPFDIQKFMGMWYAVAAIPMAYEKFYAQGNVICEGQVADYVLVDKSVHITNTCYVFDESTNTLNHTSVKGMGTMPKNNKGVMVVTFDMGKFETQPGKYVVHDTDYTTYALVGNRESVRDTAPASLWIMARFCKRIPDATYARLLQTASGLYPIDALNKMTVTFKNGPMCVSEK